MFIPLCSWLRTGPRCIAPAELAEQRGIHLMELVRNQQQGVFCIIESYCIRNEVLCVGIDLI